MRVDESGWIAMGAEYGFEVDVQFCDCAGSTYIQSTCEIPKK